MKAREGNLQPFEVPFEEQSDELSAADAQHELLKLVRNEVERARRIPPLVDEDDRPVPGFVSVLWEIECMLNPKGGSFWKLELKQRRRGKRRVPAATAESICVDHHFRVEELYEQKTRAPHKTTIGELAKEYGMTDMAIREIIRRKSGKKRKR